ncbi:hypothetical protein PRIPAC_76107 [Pristionchus pacificus]|uniref:ATP-citrate synthase ATP-grasp domain-containing protein n=1 Tax=Pristionchus pacificus TaxID=54126 RepID=A0A2A6B4S1_PRIPA|nr:hypothetical protein PRIPAC_76107 [Pristionchus pacificus]|eukprot:PDM60879.1 hypothetical protein PRIPAC_54685 [Pristionchus pacificus]
MWHRNVKNSMFEGVLKPDQLIKRRSKYGLIHRGGHEELMAAFVRRKNQYVEIGRNCGHLVSFIVEPFVAHKQKDELYMSIESFRDQDVILFYEQDGSAARSLAIPVLLNKDGQKPNEEELKDLIGDLGEKTGWASRVKES